MLGHVALVCHTMRCYSCDGLGHRARDCWYSRRQPMWNGSTRRTNEPWRRADNGTGSGHKTAVAEQGTGKAQVWMKKTNSCIWERLMISVETMVVMWTTMLEVLSDLKHLGSMEEPKGERQQVAQFVQVHRIR